MKLHIQLTSAALATLQQHQRQLAAAIGARTALETKIAELRTYAARLPAEIAELEEKAASGMDAEAATALAGKREQASLLKARIAKEEQNGAAEILQQLRATAREAHGFVGQVLRAEAEDHLNKLTSLLTPYFASEGWARQSAILFPSYQYLLNNAAPIHPDGTASLPSALELAERLDSQIEALLTGGEFLPDLSALHAAQERREEAMRAQSKQAADERAAMIQQLRGDTAAVV